MPRICQKIIVESAFVKGESSHQKFGRLFLIFPKALWVLQSTYYDDERISPKESFVHEITASLNFSL